MSLSEQSIPATKRIKYKHDNVAWSVIEQYFKDNPYFISQHHLDSYNHFVEEDLVDIIKQSNPIHILKEQDPETKEFQLQCRLYIGGKEGNKIYYGKPMIYDDDRIHYMYPNEARLRNMTYAMTVHADIDVEFVELQGDKEPKVTNMTFDKKFLTKVPVMLHSNKCVLKGMAREARFNIGECRNDPGGYFIVDGKEKVIVSQEKFADNMLYIRDSVNDMYSHSAEIRTVSDDPSKPRRTLNVRIVAPKPTQSNKQIVVGVPNIRKPVPLFILMRALGVISDKDIIRYCLLDIEKDERMIDVFIPSIHDAGTIFTQEQAIKYLATLTKGKTIYHVLDILSNYFLPNVGEMNFKNKAMYLGYIVKRLLRVYMGEEPATDRDSFKFKRIELTGSLMYDLFAEFYKKYVHDLRVAIDSEYQYHMGVYQSDFTSLIEQNINKYFSIKTLDDGIRKGFKGKWGGEAHTRREGVLQALNRLSYLSFLSHLRKLNLPMDSSAKVVEPRLLHGTQWGLIDPVDTPDGGNVGFHKHLALSTKITAGTDKSIIEQWFFQNGTKRVTDIIPEGIYNATKVFVNGSWIGVTFEPNDIVIRFRDQRRKGDIDFDTSISWDIRLREIHTFTDAGRPSRPIFYIENGQASYDSKRYNDGFSKMDEFTWDMMVNGKNGTKGIIEYMDTSEADSALIAMNPRDIEESTSRHTHLEIHPSLMLGVMGNLVIFPENNPLPRDLFSCGQARQGVSLYHSNYQNRIDKMGITLNSGQIPLIKSRYLDYVTKEQHPYGENAIVAIMAYNGYNVEDALIFNKGAIERGLFRTTYYNMYETYEESDRVAGSEVTSTFCNVLDKSALGTKPGYDYNYLDGNGMIKENTKLHDKIVLIGKATSSAGDESGRLRDASITPKKGQLGYVDKVYITEGEEGFRIAKVRIREERIPAIGDKFCSRAGQKGTVGIIVDEKDMPFTADGVRPDLIVNPHAIPSRMTIGQLVECIIGKACCQYGAFGDSTAFVNDGPRQDIFGELLVDQGFHRYGNEVMYNGMVGEQMEADIFIGPTYYLRLKHMVKDKINYRARGPKTAMTRQSVHGRAKDGGLRIGEMERDGVSSHGLSHFLQGSMLDRGDDYYMAVCNKTGCIAAYNRDQNIFLSPMADGPLKFTDTRLIEEMKVEQRSEFGRDFSIVRVPYTFKLLMQELQTMNVAMRIVTEDNIDQVMSLSHSDKNILDITKYGGLEDIHRWYSEQGNIIMKDVEEMQKEEDVTQTRGAVDTIYDFGREMAESVGFTAQSPAFAPTSPEEQVIRKEKMAIIVPYRDEPKLHGVVGQDRREHKRVFMQHMNEFLPKVVAKARESYGYVLEPKVFIVTQSNDGYKFNRGAVLNAGFVEAMREGYYKTLIMHDIDLIPQDSAIDAYAKPLGDDGKKVRHLTHKWKRYSTLNTKYLGGVTMMDSVFFNEINGFPTFFAGWGGEDDALRTRIKNGAGLPDDDKSLVNIVDYPSTIDETSFLDLEAIDDFAKKREILKADDGVLDNKKKTESRELDTRIWRVNGLRNPIMRNNFYTVLSTETTDDFNTVYVVELDVDLTDYERMYAMGERPVAEMKDMKLKDLVAIQPVADATIAPTSPAYAPTSPAYAPTSPEFVVNTPVESTSPAFAPTSPPFVVNTPTPSRPQTPASESGSIVFKVDTEPATPMPRDDEEIGRVNFIRQSSEDVATPIVKKVSTDELPTTPNKPSDDGDAPDTLTQSISFAPDTPVSDDSASAPMDGGSKTVVVKKSE